MIRNIVGALSPLLLLLTTTHALALDFAPTDDLDLSASEDLSDVRSSGLESSEVDTEQAEIRVTRPMAFGIGFGDHAPHVSTSLHAARTIDDVSTYSIFVGRGDFRTTEQNQGEVWFQNKVKVYMVGARYLFWPSLHFPFALSTGLGGEASSGKVTSPVGSSGEYTVKTLYASAGLAMSYVFENGFWLEWSLISFHYGKTIDGDYAGMSGLQMKAVRKNLEGLKITGIANLTVGYAL